MHAFTFAAALVSIVSLSAAAPTTGKSQNEVLESGKVTICTGPNKTGHCSTQEYKFNECHVLPKPYNKHVLTFVPDHQIMCRVTITAKSCTDHGDLFITSPGSLQFNNYKGQDPSVKDPSVKDYSGMTSFLCQQCTSCN